MTILSKRIDATNEKLKEIRNERDAEIRSERKALNSAKRKAYKQQRDDQARKIVLVGEAILAQLDRGEMVEEDFRKLMDNSLFRPADRRLFDLDIE